MFISFVISVFCLNYVTELSIVLKLAIWCSYFLPTVSSRWFDLRPKDLTHYICTFYK